MGIEIVHSDPEDCSREQSKEPRCELEDSKDRSAKKPDSELTEVNRITLPGQRLNNLNKWLTRSRCPVFSAWGVACPELVTRMNVNSLDANQPRLGPMRLLNEGDVRFWHLADIL